MLYLPSSTTPDDLDDFSDLDDEINQLTPYVGVDQLTPDVGVEEISTGGTNGHNAPSQLTDPHVSHMIYNTASHITQQGAPPQSTGTVASSIFSQHAPKASGQVMTDKDFARRVRGLVGDRNLSETLIKAYRKISSDSKRAKGNIQASTEALQMYADKSPQWAMTVSYKDWGELNIKVAKVATGVYNMDAAATLGQYETLIRDLSIISPAYPVKDFWDVQKEIFKHTMTLSKATFVVWSERQNKDQLWQTALDAVRNETSFTG